MSTTTPTVRWLEEEVVTEWEPVGDRMTNVRDGRTRIDFGSTHIFAYDPATSPMIRMLGSNYTTIERRKLTTRERFLYWLQRQRRALALLIDPTIEEDW